MISKLGSPLLASRPQPGTCKLACRPLSPLMPAPLTLAPYPFPRDTSDSSVLLQARHKVIQSAVLERPAEEGSPQEELPLQLKVKIGLAQSTNKLDLTDCRLRSIPVQVFELTNLEVLTKLCTLVCACLHVTLT